MKIGILTILFLSFLSCKDVTENNSDSTKTDRFELIPYPDSDEQEKYLKSKKLTAFLEKPIDLQKFKSRKNRNVTTSVTNGLKYQYHPVINDSIFYGYNFITDSIGPKGINEIIVFKYGENKHRFKDSTEILIEMRIFNKDSELGKANLIGFTKTELESEFGNNYLPFDNGIAYANKNKVLIFELKKSIVNSYKYVKLSSEKIDKDLIRQIME